MYDELFKLADKKNKIYAKGARTSPRTADIIPQRGPELTHFGGRSTAGAGTNFGSDLMKVADSIMLGAYAPAGVVIDQDMRLKQFRGSTELFLRHTLGPATLNL